ncbi:MAG TPA: DNA primase [Candidatus Saccharimonadales bacterium]|nr:DNA primase [Candidatus Saccharimonadales bacterium]
MDAVSEVKSRLNIEDVVSEYVSLKRAGKNFKGLSPFTNEKTPSFVVSPEKQIWHDFSSGRGGDMFTFIQESEGLDFKGSLELLARKAGVDLEKYRTSSFGSSKIDKSRLYKAIDSAVNFYQKQLISNQKAMDYVAKKRKFSRQTILDFRLGYSPDGSRALTGYLLKKGYKESELKLIGVANERSGQLFDMFRSRIMVPLCDQSGQAIGFTARLLEDRKDSPKYINTPSTPLYDKSRQLYGLHLAKESIRKSGYSIIAEGNLDVISSHQAGVKNVIASAGTALTEQQLKILSRFSDDVRLSFDQDRAGLEAAERSIPLASKTSINLKIITLPGGKDPDELIQKSPELWQKAIDDAEYAVDWVIERYRKSLDLSSAEGKKRFSDVMLGVIRGLSDPVEQDHYIKLCSEISGIDQNALREKIGQKSEPAQRLKHISPADQSPPYIKEQKRAADRLLCLALASPDTRNYLDAITDEMMATDTQKSLLKFLAANPKFDSASQLDELKDNLNDGKVLLLQFEELYSTVDTLELQYEASRLRAKVVEYYVKQQKTKLSKKLAEAPDSDQEKILSEVRSLDQLLKKVKDK